MLYRIERIQAMVTSNAEITKRFVEVGFTIEQAHVLTDVHNERLQNVATKDDLATTEKVLRTEIQLVKTELKAEIKALRSGQQSEMGSIRNDLKHATERLSDRMDSLGKEMHNEIKSVKWMFGISIAIITVVFTIVGVAVTILN